MDKFTKDQAKAVKTEFKQANPKGKTFCFPDQKVTVVIARTGKTSGFFTVAICADNEEFDKREGKALARNRMNFGESLPVVLGEKPNKDYHTAEEIRGIENSELLDTAERIANAVSGYY